MTFAEDIAKVAEQVRNKADLVSNEQATKISLILPFLNALGYDVFDPSEVIPEYIADFAERRQRQLEKVDYAIAINGTIVMLVEAKARNNPAEAHDGQLRRYFNGLKSAKVGIVTNGIDYRFFTDLQDQNIMDGVPFFSFNILAYDPKQIEDLKVFHRDNFDPETIKGSAERMVYLAGMTQLVNSLLRTPSEGFIRFLISQLGSISSACEFKGKVNKRVIEKFRPIVKKSLQVSLVDLMTQSIDREMNQTIEPLTDEKQDEGEEDPDDQEETIEEIKASTTAEELAAFEKVKAIVERSEAYKLEIKHKDVVSYFGINVGKPNWWFLRLYLSAKRKSFVVRLPLNEVEPLAEGFELQEMTASIGDAASRVVISSIEDLDKLSDLILKCYESECPKHLQKR